MIIELPGKTVEVDTSVGFQLFLPTILENLEVMPVGAWLRVGTRDTYSVFIHRIGKDNYTMETTTPRKGVLKRHDLPQAIAFVTFATAFAIVWNRHDPTWIGNQQP